MSNRVQECNYANGGPFEQNVKFSKLTILLCYTLIAFRLKIPYFLVTKPMGVYFSKVVFTGRIFEWAYTRVGLYSRCTLYYYKMPKIGCSPVGILKPMKKRIFSKDHLKN